MAQILENVVDAIIRIDSGLKITFTSVQGIAWFGEAEQIKSRNLKELIHSDDVKVFEEAIGSTPEFFQCEIRLIKQDSPTWTNLKCYYMEAVKQYLICVIDISAWKNTDQELIHAAQHDHLTGLSNRVLLRRIIDDNIAKSNTPFTIALLDLDGFKNINDTHGHIDGDNALIETAKRLVKVIGDNNVAVRLGGDEFVLVLEEIIDLTDTNNILNRVLRAIARPYVGEFHEAYLTASIGVASYPKHGQTYTTLMKNADIAMYKSKTSGKNQIATFVNVENNNNYSLQTALHNGIQNGEFSLVFQPQFTTDGKLTGAEALMRWDSKVFGKVPPDKFIAIAEEAGLMPYLGKWALRFACMQLKQFQKHLPNFTMAINVSPIQFKNAQFDKIVLEAISESGVNAKDVILEITESTLMQNKDESNQAMSALRATGLRFAIDDFGTGFSSLAYLTRLPVSKIKIDKTFVRALHTDTDRKLLTAMIMLAHSIDLQCVAEGVETEEQFAFLKKYNCDYIQGYLLGKPMPSKDLLELLQKESKGL